MQVCLERAQAKALPRFPHVWNRFWRGGGSKGGGTEVWLGSGCEAVLQVSLPESLIGRFHKKTASSRGPGLHPAFPDVPRSLQL